jgi:prepilin-type N-terminal cleavage/methylation domain-containing protein
MKKQGSTWKAVGGFSMIELLVVIAIGGILVTVAWARMSALVPIYRLEGAARGLAMDIQKARGRALAENKCYMVLIDTGAKTYELRNRSISSLPCGIDPTTFATPAGEGVRKIDDADRLAVAFASGSNPVFTPRGAVESTPAPVITLTNSAGAVRTVYVQPTGRINVQ